MELIIRQELYRFHVEQIKEGWCIYGKHCSWEHGKSGFISSITDTELWVHYCPSITNVDHHFKIPIEEVIKGEWEVRFSPNLQEIYEYRSVRDET